MNDAIMDEDLYFNKIREILKKHNVSFIIFRYFVFSPRIQILNYNGLKLKFNSCKIHPKLMTKYLKDNQSVAEPTAQNSESKDVCFLEKIKIESMQEFADELFFHISLRDMKQWGCSQHTFVTQENPLDKHINEEAGVIIEYFKL